MKKKRKGTLAKILGVLVAFGLFAAGSLFGAASWVTLRDVNRVFATPEFKISNKVKVADVQLGKRITNVRNGCLDCHGKDFSGNIVVNDPAIGTFGGSNLTPAALKDWTDEQIATAIRHGVDREGRPLLFMPSYEFEHLSEDDIAAIIAYLRTIPAVQKERTQQKIGPMAKILYLMGKMPTLVPAMYVNHTNGFATKPAEAPTKEFGKYLAQSSCMGCHGNRFEGGPIPGGPPNWPNAANLRLGGKSGWTEESFIKTMRTGISARTGAPLRPPVPIEAFKQMSDTEVRSLWLFFSSLD